MPTARVAQRRFDAQNLKTEIDRLKRDIVDGEFAERLAHNADWEAFGKLYRAALADRLAPLPALKEQLVSVAMSPAESTKLREQIMLLDRDRVNTEDFLGFPARITGLLKEMRERLELAEQQLKNTEGEHHGR